MLKKDLQSDILDIIETIKEIETNVLEASERLASGEKVLAEQLLSLKDEIANEEDDKGKPLYSNETKRQAALMEALQDNEEIEELETSIAEDKHTVGTLNIDLRYNKNLLDAYKLIYRGQLND